MNWSPQAYLCLQTSRAFRSPILLTMLMGGAVGIFTPGFSVTGSAHLLAQEEPAGAETTSDDDSEKTPLEKYIEGMQQEPIILQELNIPELNIEPTENDENKRKALAHFLTARLMFRRNAHQQALSELQKAADLYPSSSAIYELLIPLAIGMNQSDLVEKYLSKAENADPENYRLLVSVARYMQRQNRLDEAIRLIKRATESDRIDPKSGEYVLYKFELALLLTLTRQPEEAAKEYEVVFDAMRHPENYKLDAQIQARLMADRSQSLERIGRAFLEGNRLDLAEEAFQAASEFGTGKPAILGYNLAAVYLAKEEYEKGLTNLQAYFDAGLKNKGREAYELLEQLLAKLDRSSELIPKLEKLVEQDPRNSKLKYFLAEKYIEQDKLDEAESIIKSTLESTSDPEGQMSLARIYFKRRQPEPLLDTMAEAFNSQENLDALQEMLNEIEKDTDLMNRLLETAAARGEGDLKFEGEFLMGKLAEKARRSDLVGKFYEQAITERSSPPVFLYRSWRSWGDYLMEQDEFEPAVEVWKKAASDRRLAQFRPVFLSRAADAMVELEQFDQALEAVTEARNIGDTEEFHFQEAWIYFRAEQDDKAIASFEELRARDGVNPPLLRSTHLLLSSLYVQKGDIANGEKVLEDLIKLTPDDPTVNNDLGYLYADQGKNLDKAEEMIRKAVAAEPDNAAFLDSLGWVLYKNEKYEEAITHLKKAIELLGEEEDSTIYGHLGDCYAALGNEEEARKAWETALKIEKEKEEPSDKQVKSLEEKLSGKKETAS